MVSRFILATFLSGFGSMAAFAQVIDTFDDPEGLGQNWVTLDTNEGQPWGPGIFDTTSGALNMRTTGEVPILRPYSVLTSGFMAGIWGPSIQDPTAFADGSVRMKFRADSDADPSILLRGDASTFTAYDFAAGGGNFAIQLFVGGEGSRLATLSGVEFNQGEDWWMEAAVIGEQLSMKVWKDGMPEPAMPQLVATDATLTEGAFGIGVGLGVEDIRPTFVDASFDDISFTVPEPATTNLILLGISAPLLLLRRRHS